MIVFPLLMLYAAAMDILTMRIANNISIALVLTFFLVAPLAGFSVEQMLAHLAIGLAVLAIMVLLFHFRFIGGGDAKILAAASLWVGYEQLVPFLVAIAVFGGLLAVLILAFRRAPASALPLPGWALRLHQRGGAIPYGVAITAGALFVYPMTAVPQLLGS